MSKLMAIMTLFLVMGCDGPFKEKSKSSASDTPVSDTADSPGSDTDQNPNGEDTTQNPAGPSSQSSSEDLVSVNNRISVDVTRHYSSTLGVNGTVSSSVNFPPEKITGRMDIIGGDVSGGTYFGINEQGGFSFTLNASGISFDTDYCWDWEFDCEDRTEFLSGSGRYRVCFSLPLHDQRCFEQNFSGSYIAVNLFDIVLDSNVDGAKVIGFVGDEVVLDSQTLDLGHIFTGTQKQTDVKILSVGSEAVDISSIAVGADFALSGSTTPGSLAPGASRDLTLKNAGIFPKSLMGDLGVAVTNGDDLILSLEASIADTFTIDDGNPLMGCNDDLWRAAGSSLAFDGDYRLNIATDRQRDCNYYLNDIPPGYYKITTTWPVVDRQSSDVRYQRFVNGVAGETIQINQQARPDDEVDADSGLSFETLFTFDQEEEFDLRLRVLPYEFGKQAAADAVKVTRLVDLPLDPIGLQVAQRTETSIEFSIDPSSTSPSGFVYKTSVNAAPPANCDGGASLSGTSVTVNGLSSGVPVSIRICGVDILGRYSVGSVAETTTLCPRLPGDFNRDGSVDNLDKLIYNATYGSQTDLAADANGDGVVNAADYTVYRDNAGRTSTCFDPVAKPSNFSAVASGPDSISLSWNDNADNERGFRLSRSLNGSDFAEIAVIDAGVTSFEDTGLIPDTTYYYQLSSYNTSSQSEAETVNATTNEVPPVAVSQLQAMSEDGLEVTLNWLDNADNETGFEIRRAISGEQPALIATIGANEQEFIDDDVTGETSYTYTVTAINAYGSSASVAVEIVTPRPPFGDKPPGHVLGTVYCSRGCNFGQIENLRQQCEEVLFLQCQSGQVQFSVAGAISARCTCL